MNIKLMFKNGFDYLRNIILNKNNFIATLIALFTYTFFYWILSLSTIPIFFFSMIALFLSYASGFIFLLVKTIKKAHRKYLIIANTICGLINAILIAVFIFTFSPFLSLVALFFLSILLYGINVVFITTLFKKDEIDDKQKKFFLWVKKVFTFNRIKIAELVLVLLWGVVAFLLCMSAVQSSSDLATMTLMAKSVISGNPFLSGWAQSGITFAASDLLFYDFFTGLLGVSEYVDICATWSAFFLSFILGLIILKRNEKFNFKYFIIYFLFTIILAPLNYYILKIHAAVIVYALIILLLLNLYETNQNKKIFFLACFLITLGVMSDFLLALLYILGAFIYFVLSLIQYKNKRKHYLYCSILIAVSVGIGFGFEKLFYLIGGCIKGFSEREDIIHSFNFDIKNNLLAFFDAYIRLFGGCFYVLASPPDTAYSLIVFKNICGIILLIIFYVSATYNLIRIFKKKDRDIIIFTTSLFFYLILGLCTFRSIQFETDTRYSSAFILLGTIDLITTLMNLKFKHNIKRILNLSLITLSTIVVSYNAVEDFKNGVGIGPSYLNDIYQVLEENNLKHGFAEFWMSSEFTVKFKEKIKLLFLLTEYLFPRHFYNNLNDYHTDDCYNFIVSAVDSQYSNFKEDIVINEFGNPSYKIEFESNIPNGRFKPYMGNKFVIYVFNYNLLTKMYI